jgi:hypothetical protein
VEGPIGVERLNIPEEGAPGFCCDGLIVRGAEKDRLPRNPPDRPPPARAKTSLEAQKKMKALIKTRANSFGNVFLSSIRHLFFEYFDLILVSEYSLKATKDLLK